MRTLLLLCTCLTILLIGFQASAGAVEYDVRFLDIPPGMIISCAYAINDIGQVAGVAYDPVLGQHAVFWNYDGSPTIIGSFKSVVEIRGINNNGVVLGTSAIPSGSGYQSYSFIWSRETGIKLISRPESINYYIAEDINDAGEIVGWYPTSSGNYPFVWTEAAGLTTLSSLTGTAWGINNQGQIIGHTYDAGAVAATIWNVDGSIIRLQPLAGKQHSYGKCINDNGQVAGYCYNQMGERIISLWNADGSVVEIGSWGGNHSEPTDMNNAGSVVGFSQYPNNGAVHEFFWSADTGMTTMLLPGGHEGELNSINNRGQIAGCGYNIQVGRRRACIWTPKNQPPDCSMAVASATEIFPANNKMVSVAINGVTDPDGDPVSIVINDITQDEPVTGSNAGKSGPDGAGIGSDTALVRAERMGSGNGRVYVISFTASDGKGGATNGRVRVMVPHDCGHGSSYSDDGQFYDSTIP